MPPRTQPSRAKTAAAAMGPAVSKSKKATTAATTATPAPYQIKLKRNAQKKTKPGPSSKKAAIPSKTKNGVVEKQGKSASPSKLLLKEILTSDSEKSDEDEIPKKTEKSPSTSVQSKPSPASAKKSIDSPKKPVGKPAVSPPKVLETDSDEESDSDDYATPPIRKPVSSKAPVLSTPRPRKTLDSDSTEGSESEVEVDVSKPATARSTKNQKSPNIASRKNLSAELDKAKPAKVLESDSDDETTFESMDEEEDAQNDKNKKPSKTVAIQKEANKIKVENKKDDDYVTEGEKIVKVMSDDDLRKLVDLLESVCPVLDTASVAKRTSILKWDDITVGDWDGEACQKAWAYLRYKRRKIRNMWEIVNEIKFTLNKNITSFRRKVLENSSDYPKKPAGLSGGLSMYAHEKYTEIKDNNNDEKIKYMEWYKTMVAKYAKLPESEKKYWKDKSDAANAEYKKSLEQFFAQIPGLSLEKKTKRAKSDPSTPKKRERKISPLKVPKEEKFKDAPKTPLDPMHTFSQSKLSKLSEPPLEDEKTELIAKFHRDWHGLKDSKKFKWIDKVIKELGDYYPAVEEYKKNNPSYHPKALKLQSLLTKTEIALWESHRNKPEKPPSTPAEYYERELEQKGELSECKSEAERKAFVDASWNKLTFYEKEACKVKQQSQQLEYGKAISDYFTTLPDFLRALFISELDKKFRKYITGVDDGTAKTPRKRKRDASSEPLASGSGLSKKSKSSKKATALNLQEALDDVEKTVGQELNEEPNAQVIDIAAMPETPGKKKKKKKNKRKNDE